MGPGAGFGCMFGLKTGWGGRPLRQHAQSSGWRGRADRVSRRHFPGRMRACRTGPDAADDTVFAEPDVRLAHHARCAHSLCTAGGPDSRLSKMMRTMPLQPLPRRSLKLGSSDILARVLLIAVAGGLALFLLAP